jgi:sigma-E factor negative regulatory protein RseC
MTNTAPLITHAGIVGRITASQIEVHINVSGQCTACRVKGFCSMADVAEKKIEITNTGQDMKPGEKVNVVLRQSLGLMAVWWAYLFPLLLLLIILLLLQTLPDLYSGAAALGSVAIYYGVLYGFKEKFKKKYIFEIEKTT